MTVRESHADCDAERTATVSDVGKNANWTTGNCLKWKKNCKD